MPKIYKENNMETEQQVETYVLICEIEKMLTDYSNKYQASSIHAVIEIELYSTVVRNQYQGLLLDLGPKKVKSWDGSTLVNSRPEPDTLPPDSR